MPKLKDAEVLDVKELEEAEYEEGSFQKYDGEIPPTGTMVLMRVSKGWWTYSANDDPMLKILCVAEDNPEPLDEYDGLPAWENMTLTAGAKFKWAPFLEHFGLTIRDVRNKTMVEEEDDNQGAPITKIGSLVIGSDDCLFVAVIAKEKYKGNWQAHVAEWLDADTELEEAEEEEEPARSRSRAASNGKSSRKPTAATGRGRSRRADPDEEEPEEDEEEAEEAKPSRSGRKPAASRTKKPAPARRGSSRRSSKEDEDEPPF
jgi:hypothetical protein